MSLYHGKYRDPIYEPDPCNTLFTDWDAHNDWVITWMIDNIILREDMARANMLYTRHQPHHCLPLLPPSLRQ